MAHPPTLLLPKPWSSGNWLSQSQSQSRYCRVPSGYYSGFGFWLCPDTQMLPTYLGKAPRPSRKTCGTAKKPIKHEGNAISWTRVCLMIHCSFVPDTLFSVSVQTLQKHYKTRGNRTLEPPGPHLEPGGGKSQKARTIPRCQSQNGTQM